MTHPLGTVGAVSGRTGGVGVHVLARRTAGGCHWLRMDSAAAPRPIPPT
ncbi:hypothetical protein ACWD5R_24550 [Streptomyces sp. NPDC002514]